MLWYLHAMEDGFKINLVLIRYMCVKIFLDLFAVLHVYESFCCVYVYVACACLVHKEVKEDNGSPTGVMNVDCHCGA